MVIWPSVCVCVCVCVSTAFKLWQLKESSLIKWRGVVDAHL